MAEVVDHADPQESAQFRALSAALFQKGPTAGTASSTSDGHFETRTAVYEEMLQFFPSSHKQPKDSLIDIVPL